MTQGSTDTSIPTIVQDKRRDCTNSFTYRMILETGTRKVAGPSGHYAFVITTICSGSEEESGSNELDTVGIYQRKLTVS